MHNRDKLYINGTWVSPHGTGVIDVFSSADESVMGRIPEGDAVDMERAIEAAHAAFPGWSQTSVEDRANALRRVSEQLGARSAELAEMIALETGMPLRLSQMIQVGMPVFNLNVFANAITELPLEETVGNSLVVREPIGVVGCITPWNYPLHQIVAKVGPAMAAGCTVVLKPSEIAPLDAFVLAEAIDAAGIPKGVFNLVTGYGPVVGEVMSGHPLVDMISFTGSTAAGRRVTQRAAETIKRVALELGGKSANVILDDADFATAIPNGVQAAYLNSGQTCSALTRMLVPKARRDEAVALAKQTVEAMNLCDPLSGNPGLGPLASAAQRDRVRAFIRKGIEEGATLVTGGAEAPAGFEKGYYVKPTVFADVTNAMTIGREEIFGPVLSILCYDDEEDAIRIANDSVYGLSGGVWSSDPERAQRVARRLRTGQVFINGGNFNLQAPFGGYKQSGNGREMGRHGLEEFFETKAMQL